MAEDVIHLASWGVSPAFAITAEEFKVTWWTGVTEVDIDGVDPPDLGAQYGPTDAMNLTNQWFPWIDEHICEPKYDGICQYLGIASNRPTQIKDYHWIALMRATDYILKAQFNAYIKTKVLPPSPSDPPPDSDIFA